jgi:type III pantothenate kinase
MTAATRAPSAGNARSVDVLAIDVGSSCVKLGWFPASGPCAGELPSSELTIAAPALPIPDEIVSVQHRSRDVQDWGDKIDQWLDGITLAPSAWRLIASVRPNIASSLVERLQRRSWARLQLITAADLRLDVRTKEPSRVGIDRLLGALAVNRLRSAGSPAISVDMGTATTVDLVAADGAFEGGAILAGPWLSLSALHAGTASLPSIDAHDHAKPPAAVGKTTEEALAAGAFWGAVGGVNELARRAAGEAGGEPELFLTGGAAPAFADFVTLAGRQARHVPHLVLAGIYLVGEGLSAERLAP